MNGVKTIGLGILTILLFPTIQAVIELETKSLLENKIELKIPKDFNIMSEEMMKLKYPSERRPSVVFTNESGGINVALNLTDNKASQDQIESYKDYFVQTFKNLYPSAEWKDSGMKKINGQKVGYLELITPAIDTKIYNLMFFTDLEGKLLLCTFNCTLKSVEEWQPVAKEIMTSLKITGLNPGAQAPILNPPRAVAEALAQATRDRVLYLLTSSGLLDLQFLMPLRFSKIEPCE